MFFNQNTFWNQFFKSYSYNFLIFVPYLQGDHELQKNKHFKCCELGIWLHLDLTYIHIFSVNG